MKNVLKIAAVFIGTIVGAGLASGQEILQFFSLYGLKGFSGIILCCFLYIIFSSVIISLCFKFKFKSYRDIILFVFGNKAGRIVEVITTFFIFSGNVIMISGGGTMLNEYLGINKIWGIMIMIIFTFAVTYFSTHGIIAANSIIVPFSTMIIIILGLLVFATFRNSDAGMFTRTVIPLKNSYSWIISSIIYSSFNLLVATGVICPMICEANNKRQFRLGCLLGSFVLTLLALSINFSILYYCPRSLHCEIPNLYIAKEYGRLLPLFLTIIIWFEMFTTEIGNLYSLSKALTSSIKISYTNSLLLILTVSIPFTFVGFSNLIRLFYPPFGVLSFVFILGCLYKYIKIKH